MKIRLCNQIFLLILALGAVAATTRAAGDDVSPVDPTIGPVEVFTVPFGPALRLRTATYTLSGKVLVVYHKDDDQDRRFVNLAVMNDDGTDMRPFFLGRIPDREKDNGIRFMMFPDNQQIFLGDFVIECVPDIDTCEESTLLPVGYPAEVAGGEHISHRWSEIIVAPDNEHIAWTTLFSDYSAMVFTGKLERGDATYTIADTRIVSTLDPFGPDPEHPDGVIPGPQPGIMDLKITFGPLYDDLSARIVFAEDDSGVPLSHGYTEYGGKRLTGDSLVP